MCPDAGDSPCAECGIELLNRGLATPQGEALMRAAEIKLAMKAGVVYTPEDILFDEFQALLALQAEQERLEQSAQRVPQS
jgi:hypothetical protein